VEIVQETPASLRRKDGRRDGGIDMCSNLEMSTSRLLFAAQPRMLVQERGE